MPQNKFSTYRVGDIETSFQCPICGADQYEEADLCTVVDEVSQDIDLRVNVHQCEPAIGYECFGCSTLFTQPSKFSKIKPAAAGEGKRIYLVVLDDGRGERRCFIISKEIHDWINSSKLTDEDREELGRRHHVEDSTTPQELQDARSNNGQDPLVRVTTGSFKNDKMLGAIDADLAEGAVFGELDADRWAKDHGYIYGGMITGLIY